MLKVGRSIFRKALLQSLAISLVFASPSLGAMNNPASLHGSKLFTANGTLTVPSGVFQMFLDGCSVGGSGGGGQSGGAGAGGSGGGASMCAQACPLEVTPGLVLTVTLPAATVGGAVGVAGSNGLNVTITGQLAPPTLVLLGGIAGQPGAAGVGATGATSSFAGAGRAMGGIAGAAAAASGGNHTNNLIANNASLQGCIWDGLGSGGGGSTASQGGSGGRYVNTSTGGQGAAAGSGNGSGSGAGGSLLGAGQPGTAVTVDCNQSPSWTGLGYGGGGCGGGSGAKGGPGGPAFARLWW